MSNRARSGREPDANAVERTGRAISDTMDKYVGRGITRDVAHGVWHTGAAAVRGATGNFDGAKAELNRAGHHFTNAGQRMDD